MVSKDQSGSQRAIRVLMKASQRIWEIFPRSWRQSCVSTQAVRAFLLDSGSKGSGLRVVEGLKSTKLSQSLITCLFFANGIHGPLQLSGCMVVGQKLHVALGRVG